MAAASKVQDHMSDLRDLARKIEAVASEHPSYPQAAKAVSNLVDHLTAMAGYHEQVQRLALVTRELADADLLI